jgi:hypothetical protein
MNLIVCGVSTMCFLGRVAATMNIDINAANCIFFQQCKYFALKALGIVLGICLLFLLMY